MATELLNQTYTVQATVGDQTVTIYADVSNSNEVTLRNEQRHPQFAFTKSDPDLITAMAQAFSEAAALVTKEAADG